MSGSVSVIEVMDLLSQHVMEIRQWNRREEGSGEE